MNSKKSRLSQIRGWNRKRKQKDEEKKRIIEAINLRKSIVEKTEEPTLETITEETTELSSESIVEKTEEPTLETITEETTELSSESIVEKTEEPTKDQRRLGIRSLFK
ncbi:hypothetical protein MUO66_06905, partial [Candidatus Bathyarchaeota archaeon]|nr:hypothetical protein [Candidatus Bathyarchaeota archaeon]